MKTFLVISFIFIFLLLSFSLYMCNNPNFNFGYKLNKCTIKVDNFKGHTIKHFHKSKHYDYYHNNPCDCNQYGDLYDTNYRKDKRDYKIYYKE
jgi:hypothetical protein